MMMVTFLGTGAAGLFASVAVVTGALALEVPAGERMPSSAKAHGQAVALVSQGVIAKAPDDPGCPAAEISADANEFPPRESYYRATVDGLARDCANLGAETILKVGVIGQGQRVSGRGPSDLMLPLKLVVIDAAGKTVEARVMNAALALPNGTAKASFKHLEEGVSIPTSQEGYRGWKVVIQFGARDAAGGAQGRERHAGASARRIAARRAARTARRTPNARSRPRGGAEIAAANAPAPSEATPGTFWGRFGSTPGEARAYAPTFSVFGYAGEPASEQP